ncbi:MAG: hypothetical protein KDG89_01885 [Geminicoccaceae bacterium]|nr:hypothetical protein [Geminicoccaceae bacterium]
MASFVPAYAAGALLAALVAVAVLAGLGLRARAVLVLLGPPLGAGLAALVPLVDPTPVLALYLDALGLVPEILLTGLIKGLVAVLLLGFGLGLLLALPVRHRRRADLLAAGCGLGLGYGLADGLAFLAVPDLWPPAAFLVAATDPALSLAFGTALGASLLPGWRRSLGLRAAVVLAAAAYAALRVLNDEVGHWLLWLEPLPLGLAWLGLAALVWAAALLVIGALRWAGPARPPTNPRLLLRPRLWFGLAFALLLVAAALWFAAMLAPPESPFARLFLTTLLAVPLMAGAVLLAAGLRLREG